MKRHALIVGINHYQDPALNDLKGAERDAADLYGIVRDRLHFDAAEYLPAPSSDELIAKLDGLIAGLHPGDQFVFFYAGHGVLDDAQGHHQGEQLLLMPNVRYSHIRHRMNTVSVGLLRDETAGRGLQRVFILDCCRSNLEAGNRDGARTVFRSATVLRDLAVRARRRADLPPESLSILCSCDDGHQAAEIPGGQGLFTAALAQRLRSAAQAITLDQAFVAALTGDMRALAQVNHLDHDQQPLWLPNGANPVLWTPPSAPDQTEARDAMRWAMAEQADSIEAYRAYLAGCEACARREQAEAAIQRLQTPPPRPTPTPDPTPDPTPKWRVPAMLAGLAVLVLAAFLLWPTPPPPPVPEKDDVGAASAANRSGQGEPLIAAEAAPTQAEQAERERQARAQAKVVSRRVQGRSDLRLEHPLGYAKLDAQSRELGDAAGEWSMVLDVNTGLMWEHKTDDGGLRDKGNDFTWYDPNSPDGNPGKRNGGQCTGGIECDTHAYVQAVNAAKLGGYTDWRLPTREELKTLVAKDQPRGWKMQPEFFADKPEGGGRYEASGFWSASVDADSTDGAWGVYFGLGYGFWNKRSAELLVRLVREGQ